MVMGIDADIVISPPGSLRSPGGLALFIYPQDLYSCGRGTRDAYINTNARNIIIQICNSRRMAAGAAHLDEIYHSLLFLVYNILIYLCQALFVYSSRKNAVDFDC